MATLIKRSQSPYWYAQFYTDGSGGEFRQHRVSTKIRHKGLNRKDYLANEKTAKRVAAQIEEEFKQDFRGNAQGREISVEVYDILKRASVEALKGELSVDKGKRYIVDLSALCSGEAIVEHDIETWRDEFVRIKQDVDRVSLASLSKYKQHLREFVEGMKARGKVKLTSISRDDLRGYQRELAAQGLSIATTNAHIKSIKAYFRKAVIEMLVTHSPADGVDLIKARKSEVANRKPFSTDEINSLIQAAPNGEWRTFIKMGFYTGLRLSDIAGLRWSNIDQENEVIEITTAKTEKEITIPIFSSELLLELRELNHGIGEAPLFPTLSGLQVGSRTGLSQTFNIIMDSAGVSRGRCYEAASIDEGDTRGRSRHERGFHSLRGSFVSHLANSNVPKEIRMKLTGHDDSKVHDIYTTLEADTIRQHIQTLPSVG